jgi:hypothetical protein
MLAAVHLKGRDNMKTTWLLTTAVLTLLMAPAAQAGDKLAGAIGSFECGDNCYLTIVTEDGTDLTGLCAAPACENWNAEVMIPEDQIGRYVLATVGTADQVDGSGTVMGSFVAFYEIEFMD